MNDNADHVIRGIGAIILLFLIQALVIGAIVSFIWAISLQHVFNIYLNFFHWVGIVFSFNLIRFNLIKTVMEYQNNNENEIRKDDTEDNN